MYDRDRRCTNPIGVEDDLARTGGRLRVAPVVCPSGT
ncbi:MAG: hypothetical protein ACREJ5_04795 [Geminicoccaceae bacterium]